jgi:hypothetical protein
MGHYDEQREAWDDNKVAPKRGHSPKGEPALRRAGLDAANKQMTFLLRNLGITREFPQKTLDAMTRGIVRQYLKADREHYRGERLMAPLTRQLINMQVGDVIAADGVVPQTARGCMHTARRAMGNPLAVWSRSVADGRVVIKRLPDGSRHEPEVRSDRPKFLAAMAPGEVKTTRLFPARSHLSVATKVTARRILGDPNADWRGRTTNKGVQVVRVK